MKMRNWSMVAAAICGAVLAENSLRAENIAAAEAQASATTATLDSGPIVTAILSQPGTVNGRTYTNWAVLANDGTGSMELFGAMPGGFVPAVGDNVTVSGTVSPFHQIPELATLTAITRNSAGNPIPSVGLATIPQLNQATQPLTNVIYLWELDNVTVSGEGSGNWGTSNSPTGALISDGVNSMTLFYWPTSYSLVNANLANTPIPTGPVNMIGFVSNFNNIAEFTPISVTSAVPEPASLALLGAGVLMLMGRRRKA